MNTICNASKIGYIPMFGNPREESIQIRGGGGEDQSSRLI